MEESGVEAAGEEALLDRLTDLAPSILNGGRPDRLSPELEQLVKLDFSRHPWACLVTAAALHDVNRTDPRARKLLDQADSIFHQQNEDTGLGYAAYVRGNFALGHGCLDEAAKWWQRARQWLPSVGPADVTAQAHLALAAYQAGDLRRARTQAEEALAMARSSGHRQAEGIALIYLSLFYIWSGKFGRCESALRQADDVYAEFPDPHDRFEYPLIGAGQGVLACLRGEQIAAEAAFQAALLAAEELEVSWYKAIILTLRSEFCSAWTPHQSLADGRTALEELVKLGDDWWCYWARRALAVASAAAGESAAAIAGLRALLDEPMNGLEQARTELLLGEAYLRADETEPAVPLLKTAHLTLERTGADYWEARALVALARAEPGQALIWRRQAKAYDDGDPAYRYLLFGRSELSITMLGEPGVKLRGQRVKFETTNAELAVYALALVASGGLHDEVLGERLWPEAPADRVGQRLRTLAWQIRKGLGCEAWRLERQRQMNRLEVEGVAVDVAEARTASLAFLEAGDSQAKTTARQAAEDALLLLNFPLLESHQYEEWVQREAAELGTLANRLGRALRPSDTKLPQPFGRVGAQCRGAGGPRSGRSPEGIRWLRRRASE